MRSIGFNDKPIHYINRLLPDCKDTPFFVYIHGSAGTGKTTLLNVLRDDVNNFIQSKEACLVTAPTGSAARDVKGKTLHQTFGISIDEAHAFQLLKPAMYKILRAMLGKTKVLFIDEISLVSALLFAQTSANIQMALGFQKPFGGLSVVLFGDLLQLSPVNGNPIYEEVSERFSIARITRAPCVTYRLWDLFKMFRLFENVRSDDEAEARMLMEVREERISEETENFFKRHFVIRNSTDSGIFDEVDLLRRLYPEKEIAILAVRNIVVNRMNEIVFNKFDGQVLIIYIVSFVALYKVCVLDYPYQQQWLVILGSCIGYLLPNPKIKEE
ncbi:hypothetical protein CAEBREN_19206 [Caenorhabditis brenneri]|uniref:ATP-dependent DNA helicase n=1 Tax=Caenorhabditis brenneri TaxID=135651 RepID=G0PCT4_CAEBE|nr:hypothetical protein CAEBREN_19206 [Caenorhabditis brenneri]